MEEKFYAVAGYDNLYAGRDGMIKRKVIYGTEDLACEVAKGLAEFVISSYRQIGDDLEEVFHNDCDSVGINDYLSNEADKLRNFIWADDREWEVHELDESILPTKHPRELTDMYNNNPEDFINKYARGLGWVTM